jgi:hypothetical protein
MLGQELGRLATIPFRLSQLFFESTLAGFDRTEHRRPGKSPEHEEQRDEYDHRPEHQPKLDRERALRGFVLESGSDGQQHGDSCGMLLAMGYGLLRATGTAHSR